MTDKTKQTIRRLLEIISEIDYIKPEDLPNISLYMDQVTTFMDEQLSSSKRYEDDKILTKTMINNYAKNHLLPPPDKKRYSKEHLLMLIFIYYFKNILTISDIQTLLDPITKNYFQTSSEHDMTYVYREVFQMIREQSDSLPKELLKRYQAASGTFLDAPAEDQEFLQTFSYICLLAFDVYTKKMLIERLIDGMSSSKGSAEKKPKKEKKQKGQD